MTEMTSDPTTAAALLGGILAVLKAAEKLFEHVIKKRRGPQRVIAEFSTDAAAQVAAILYGVQHTNEIVSRTDQSGKFLVYFDGRAIERQVDFVREDVESTRQQSEREHETINARLERFQR